MKKMMMLTTTAYMSERFNRDNILILEEMGYEVHVVANFDKGNPTTTEVLERFKCWIKAHHGKWHSIVITKNPTDIVNNYKAYRQIIKLIRENKYDFIHCHTPVGGVLGRVVAHKMHTKVIYTAHGFHFFDGAPLKNWVLYYPVEYLLSKWTDVLITINEEDYRRANNRFSALNTEYIPGVGIDLEKFKIGVIDRNSKRKELGLRDKDIMLLSVGELSPNKNHEMVIRVLKQIEHLEVKYFICGVGQLEEKYSLLINELNLEKKVFLLKYREDVSELCQSADLYIFPSLREGLPVALMEAIATKRPVLCGKVRGNMDLVKDERCFFDPQDKEDVLRCILNALHCDFQEVIEENYERLQAFSREKVIHDMVRVYESIAKC